MKFFMPPFFGVFSFSLYLVIYLPAPGSEDFITALLVFFAAQAFSAVIILSKENRRWLLYLYLLISVLFPLMIPLVFEGFNELWHMVLIGLTVVATIGLLLFVPGYLKYRKRDDF